MKHFGCTHFCLRRCEVPVKCRCGTLPAGFHELPTSFGRPAVGRPLPRRIVHLLLCCWPVCRGLRLLVPLSSLHCASTLPLFLHCILPHLCLRSGLVDHLPMFFHQRRSTLLPRRASTSHVPLLPSHTHADTWRLDFLRLPGLANSSMVTNILSKFQVKTISTPPQSDVLLRCVDLTMVRNTLLTRDHKAAVTQCLNTHEH